jgi:predicted dehydrogenase
VDTAQALIGATIEDVAGLPGSGDIGSDEAIVALRFADGSLASIAYSSAAPSAGKEWIEVLAETRRLVIEDFRSATLDGRTLWKGKQDKGHRAQVKAFRDAVLGQAQMPTEAAIRTMRATIQAASLQRSSIIREDS